MGGLGRQQGQGREQRAPYAFLSLSFVSKQVAAESSAAAVGAGQMSMVSACHSLQPKHVYPALHYATAQTLVTLLVGVT